ncbi:hypothetical protein AOC05_07165 [Arthrobacter alpinus]|uniref:Uncharacterized protein n=1 Tax=Arthrobacter alpinus TaxID=656366 RepID=A0A0M3UFZ0_9MICC|nr:MULTISPECIES: hypothetical protein [Arthrobacter]ALE92165.1 hypothetical protein AOC05_07165 [Arthrobacter alpinus]
MTIAGITANLIKSTTSIGTPIHGLSVVGAGEPVVVKVNQDAGIRALKLSIPGLATIPAGRRPIRLPGDLPGELFSGRSSTPEEQGKTQDLKR